MSMIIGGPSASSPAGGSAHIKDGSTASFEADVIAASMERPVLVDFWASWCGPCRQLTPIIEKVVTAANGAVQLVKINADENPELTQALRIQSLPTVIAFFQGRPLDAFMGAQPESQIKRFVDGLVQQAGGAQGAPQVDEALLEKALDQAKTALDGGDPAMAVAIYRQIIDQLPDHPAAYAGLVRAELAAGQPDQAQAVLDQVPESLSDHAEIQGARKAVTLAQEIGPVGPIAPLTQAVEANPDDLNARFDLAMAQYGAGQAAAAIDQLLEILRRDRGWEDEKARKQILTFFEALGPTDPVVIKGRRKLSALLFS